MVRVLLVLALAIAGIGVVPAQTDVDTTKGGADVTGPYDVVENWPLPIHDDGWSWGSIPAVWAESEDRVLVFMRGEKPSLKLPPNPANVKGYALGLIDAVRQQSAATARQEHVLMVFNREGSLIESWEHLIPEIGEGGAHRITMDPYDPDKHIWLVDYRGHQILKVTHDGSRVVMRLGEKGVAGADHAHFNQPSDMAFMPNGDFYVTDGYQNTRVVKFAKDGTYLLEWGEPGTGPGEFDHVHGIVVDANRRLYVGDRENGRIQIFDENGTFLDQWTGIPHPYFLYMAEDQHVWVSDGLVHKIMKFDLDGHLLYSWGTFGRLPGQLWGPHQLNVDEAGNLYVANAQGNNVVKFRPKPGADPARLIGKPFLLPVSQDR